jgi:hypothetical protein
MYALLAFAAVFLVVGVHRVVEFKAAGINAFQRKILIPLHVAGCLAFTGCIILMAIDIHDRHRLITTELFFSSVFVLFPIHIYVAVKRRILVKNQSGN